MHELVTNAQRTTFTARSQQTLGKANPITQTTQVIKSPMTTPHTLLQQKYKKYMYLLGVSILIESKNIKEFFVIFSYEYLCSQ